MRRWLLPIVLLWLIIPAQAEAAIAVVGQNSCGATNTNNCTTSTTNIAAANAVVCSTSHYLPEAALTSPTEVFDSGSNTYTRLTGAGTQDIGNTGTPRISLWYSVGGTYGGSHTWTVNKTGTFPSILCIGFSGVKSSGAFDQESGNEQLSDPSTTVALPGAVTPSANNAVFVTAVATQSGSIAPTGAPTGYTLSSANITGVGGQYYGNWIAYKIKTDGTAENPSWTLASAPDHSAMIIMDLLEQVGGGSTPTKSLLLLGVGGHP